MTWRCAILQKRLPAYLEGEINPWWRRLLEGHLKVCPECRQELKELEEVVALYRAHPLPDPGPEFWARFDQELHLALARVNQEIQPEPKRMGLPYYLGGAIALVGVLALAVYLGPFLHSPSSPALRSPTAILTPEVTLSRSAPAQSAPGEKVLEAGAKGVDALGPPKTADETVARPSPLSEPRGVTLAAGRVQPEEEEEFLVDEDFPTWDVDSVISDLTPEERQSLKERLEMRR